MFLAALFETDEGKKENLSIVHKLKRFKFSHSFSFPSIVWYMNYPDTVNQQKFYPGR
jgi:hypothetical protein